MDDLRSKISDDEHGRRMSAAYERAAWELGDPGWAGVIVGAYLHPDEDEAALKREKEA